MQVSGTNFWYQVLERVTPFVCYENSVYFCYCVLFVCVCKLVTRMLRWHSTAEWCYVSVFVTRNWLSWFSTLTASTNSLTTSSYPRLTLRPMPSPRLRYNQLYGIAKQFGDISIGSRLVFFYLFSEVEVFTAILIAHGTRVFWGNSWGPKGRNSMPKGDSGGGVLRERAASPSPPARGSRGALWAPPVEFGVKPQPQIHFGPSKSLENTSSGHEANVGCSLIFLLSTSVKPLDSTGGTLRFYAHVICFWRNSTYVTTVHPYYRQGDVQRQRVWEVNICTAYVWS